MFSFDYHLFLGNIKCLFFFTKDGLFIQITYAIKIKNMYKKGMKGRL